MEPTIFINDNYNYYTVLDKLLNFQDCGFSI